MNFSSKNNIVQNKSIIIIIGFSVKIPYISNQTKDKNILISKKVFLEKNTFILIVPHYNQLF